MEFIADQEAQREIECSKSYQTVMLKTSLSQNRISLSNDFYQSLIKKRIVMLQKSKSKKRSKLKLIIVLPFLALFLMSFNVEEIYVVKAKTPQLGIVNEVFIISSKASDKQLENIKNKLEAKIDGLKISFSNLKRNANGEITTLSIATKLEGNTSYNRNVTYESKASNPIEKIIIKIINGELVFGDEKQDAIMRATEKGVITDKLPVKKETARTSTIHTQGSGDNIKIEIISNNKENGGHNYEIVTEEVDNIKSELHAVGVNSKPLYIVNEIIVEEIETNITAEKIVSVNVLKGKVAREKYGEKGKDGVVVITTENNNNITNVLSNNGNTVYVSKNELKESNYKQAKKENPWKIQYEVSEIKGMITGSDSEKRK